MACNSFYSFFRIILLFSLTIIAISIDIINYEHVNYLNPLRGRDGTIKKMKSINN